MTKIALNLSAAALLAMAGRGVAQQNLILTNPGFEQDDPTGITSPLGWLDFNASSSASTAAFHSGLRSLQLVFGNSNFAGSTTNYFDPNTLTYPYDPVITYRGGAITVSGWYMIPADHPIGNSAWASIKLQVRRTVNNSSYQDFEWPVIMGSTNGVWTYFERTVQDSDFGVFPLEPTAGQPTRCSVLPIMFGPNGIDPNAKIYWDDLRLVQSSCYPNCDGSTTAPILNVADFSCFLNAFAAGESYANCDHSTTPPILNVADFSCFLNSFAAGCS